MQQDYGTIAVYGHINEYYVQAGDRVNASDVIASVGNRGQSTGPHLHLEIWDQNSNKIDPVAWLAGNGVHRTALELRLILGRPCNRSGCSHLL